MGHDIYGMKVTEEIQEALREKHQLDNHNSKDWFERYSEYTEEVYCAQFRRSAFDPNNILVYRLLGAEDLYGGASGVGATRTFTRAEIELALDSLPYVLADGKPQLDDNLAHMILEKLGQVLQTSGGVEIQRGGPVPDDDLSEERQFFQSILNWMRETGKKQVEIYFG